MTREHELKCWPPPFDSILSGIKTHEIRKNDRNYAAGDVLHLREWRPDPWDGRPPPGWDSTVYGYTGREIRVRVTYVTFGGDWGVPDDMCVMSIAKEQP